MLPIELFAAFLAGSALVLLLMLPRMSRATKNALDERTRADANDAARQRFEVDLAACRPEANRSAQLTIDILRISEMHAQLESKCSRLEATIEERERALSQEREDAGRLLGTIAADLESERSDLHRSNERILQLETERATFNATLEEREAALRQERDQLDQFKGQLKSQFAELSAEALKSNNDSFLDLAKRVLALQHQEAGSDLAKRQEAIRELVQPLHDGLKAVTDTAKEMESKREHTFGSLEEQLKNSIAQSAEVARQAGGLRDALKKPNVRGRWGEVQLKNCIDLAGMDEHCDVTFQDSAETDDKERIRPDMTVRMPGGRKVAVDSKTPMEFFLQYVEATTEEARNAALIGHARVVKSHIDKLIRTDYMQKVVDSPDFVVMFLPNESFLAMALEKEPALMEDALKRKVLIATPGTLIGLLKVIRYGWNEQRLADNAMKIADMGSKLNTEIVRFLEDFTKVGEALKTASDAYEGSFRRVEKQIANRSRDLTRLGAKSSKALKSKAALSLLSGSLDDEEDEAIAILTLEADVS